MKTARRTAEIQPFAVMDVLARARELQARGRRVIHMEIGEPDFTAAPQVVAAAVRALRGGRSAYTPTLGLPRLREAIARHYDIAFSRKISAERIAITSGASGGLLLAVAACAGPGDEVLVPDPGYPGYRHMVRAFEAHARALRVSAATNFQPTLEMVRAAWGPRTRALILGSPSNPTGTIIARDELTRIARFIATRRGVLIADEIYQELVYGRAPETALGLPGEAVVINSFSKYFCMTGWRLGWVVLPKSRKNARMRDFEKLAQHLTICAPSIAQHAAIACFRPRSLAVLERRRREFARRRDFLVPALERAGLVVPARPAGAFYVYARCPEGTRESGRFALQLLERAGVAATPGADFGVNGTQRFVRFAYTRPMAELREAVRRLARFLAARPLRRRRRA